MLSLRVMDPGRLMVEAGDEIIAAGELNWGEDERLRVDPLEGYPPAPLPRVVSSERGREEVEVDVPEGTGAGAMLTLSYEWAWHHQDTPALERTWRLPPMEDIPPEWLEDERVALEREDTAENEEEGALALLSAQDASFPVQEDPARSELLWVPGYASREDIASRLFGDAAAVGAFDIEPRAPPSSAEEGLQVCVRVRHPPALVPQLLTAMRRALEAQLEADVAWSRSQLSAAPPDGPGAAALVERGLRWAQRSNILDGAGQSYFDRYLQALEPWWDESQRVHLLAGAAEPLRKAIALRSKRFKVSYSVTDGSPVLAPGSVVGRFYFAGGSSVQVRTLLLLTEETSLERAELRVRNAFRGSPRVILPGKDGRWRGYSAEFNTVAGAPQPLEELDGNAYWYYPDTLLIRPGDWRPGLGAGTGELAALRRELLQTALATATPQEPRPLLALDHDVLEARGSAVRLFVGRMSLVATLAAVDTYRDELSRTSAGRAFLAVHDLAMVALAGRDISKLASSGIGRELVNRGRLALSAAGARASSGLRESVESVHALVKTLERMLAEGEAVATPDGLRFSLPGGAEAFKQAFFAIRGEMAAARAIGGIRSAGLAAEKAEKTLHALKLLAAESQEMALAYGAVARRAAALPADKAQAYLSAVELLRSSTPSAAKPALARLLRRSGAPSLKDPLALLKQAQWLVSHPELDAEAVVELARKACKGSVDLGWLRSTGLSMKDLDFMGRNRMTSWKDFQQAAAEPWNSRLQRRVREQLRGVAAEMLTEDNAQKLFKGFRLTGRQVKMRAGHIIDNVLTATAGSKLQHGVEVKGWNDKRWRRALDSWLTRDAGRKLDEQQEALVKQLQHLIDQLADAAKAPHGQPFLVSTDNLSGPTRAKLLGFLLKYSPGTKVIQLEEAQILDKTRQLRAALSLPENLSGGAP
ncbi:MAG TPA: hypothetical protein VFZ09_04280 [Archangium sp.]|uniref:hypothetical protein n=1 Tax=Archangium sp. TaxID=1872627 RepID=UPI002E2FAF9B|nr:hypothetical protein [Archangium sp.]HEX5745437.1 hypothetical protein [Archangium sp.]